MDKCEAAHGKHVNPPHEVVMNLIYCLHCTMAAYYNIFVGVKSSYMSVATSIKFC